MTIPMVHADDVAEAIARVLDRKLGGPVNLAADPPITTQRIADALGARLVHVPSSGIRLLMSATWHARLQPLEPGWLDMGFASPLLDTSRAVRELDWAPTVDGVTVLREVLSGMRNADAAATPVLRPRSVGGSLRDFVTRGPVGQRSRP